MQLDGAARRADVRRLDGVLDRDRQAVQRAQVRTARGAGVGGLGGDVRLVGGERHHGVDGGVEPLDAVEVELEQLAALDLTVADRGGEVGGGLHGPVVVEHAAMVRRPRRPGSISDRGRAGDRRPRLDGVADVRGACRPAVASSATLADDSRVRSVRSRWAARSCRRSWPRGSRAAGSSTTLSQGRFGASCWPCLRGRGARSRCRSSRRSWSRPCPTGSRGQVSVGRSGAWTGFGGRRA